MVYAIDPFYKEMLANDLRALCHWLLDRIHLQPQVPRQPGAQPTVEDLPRRFSNRGGLLMALAEQRSHGRPHFATRFPTRLITARSWPSPRLARNQLRIAGPIAQRLPARRRPETIRRPLSTAKLSGPAHS